MAAITRDIHGIILVDFMPCGAMVTAVTYQATLRHLHKEIGRLLPMYVFMASTETTLLSPFYWTVGSIATFLLKGLSKASPVPRIKLYASSVMSQKCSVHSYLKCVRNP
jgi:hypothetical protein